MQFQKKFGTEKACQKHLFRLRWPEGFRCPRCQHGEAYFQRSRNLYHCKACGYQASLTAGTVFHKTRTPLHQMVLDDLAHGPPEERHFHVVLCSACWKSKPTKPCGPWATRFAKPWPHRDANYQLAGLIEMDDTYFGAPKPGKRGRGAAGKAKVVVAVETPAE